MLALTFLVDWWMYGSWVVVPLNFLKFNFLSSGGDYYGTHKWHWYFTQGFTVMLFTFLPISVAGICKSKEWRLSGLIAWVLGIYSIPGHKEFRYPFTFMWSWITILIGVAFSKFTNWWETLVFQVCSACASHSIDVFRVFISCNVKTELRY